MPSFDSKLANMGVGKFCYYHLVVINGILGELGNEVDGSLFADNLVVYITTKNQRVATKALQDCMELPTS